MWGFRALFEVVPDPRAGNARHLLSDILLMAFAATLCGAESCVEMAEFAAAKQDLLVQALSLKHGVPSHDTFARVLRRLDPKAFEAAFRRFMAGFAAAQASQAGTGQAGTGQAGTGQAGTGQAGTGQAGTGQAGTLIALDGKSLRGAVDAASRSTPLHLVTAWAAEQRLVLGLRRAPGRSEVTAAREIIALLDLHGATVTADALHASRRTAAAIRAQGGDYALTVKGNRGPLHTDAQALLAEPDPAACAATVETGHGRREERKAWVLPVPADWAETHGFEGLSAIARIDSLRVLGGREERQTRHVALSRQLAPAEALRVVRAHWPIENNQHWLLDVAFNEDGAHTRDDTTAENLAILRRLALNLMRTDTLKKSIRTKIKRAGWHDEYLLTLLSQMR